MKRHSLFSGPILLAFIIGCNAGKTSPVETSSQNRSQEAFRFNQLLVGYDRNVFEDMGSFAKATRPALEGKAFDKATLEGIYRDALQRIQAGHSGAKRMKVP